MHRRPEFSFPGSPARGPMERALPPRPPVNATAPRPREEEEVRWLQASLQASPDNYYNSSSGTPSPQLWSSSHNHEHRLYPASAGSSPSRAQAIAGYRREMLELVRGLPESAYELSLRDIVEHHHRPSPSPSSSSSSAPLPTPPLPPPPTTPPPPSSSNAAGAAARVHEPATTETEQGAKQSKKQGRKQGRAATMMRRQRSRSLERSVSLDTGLLIKFFMPLSLGRGGKKKVSPKPDAAAKDAKKKKKKEKKQRKEQEPIRQQQEEEWWSKSDAGSSNRTSSTGSSNSNSSAGSSVINGRSNPPKAPPVRSRSRKRNGCYAFFRANKSKSGVSQD